MNRIKFHFGQKPKCTRTKCGALVRQVLYFINFLILFSCQSERERELGIVDLKENRKLSIQIDNSWEYPTYKFNFIFNNKLISKNTEFFYDAIDFNIEDFKVLKCEIFDIVYVQYKSKWIPLIIFKKNTVIYVNYSYPINESKYIKKEKANLLFNSCKGNRAIY